jgi:hypothetical protein
MCCCGHGKYDHAYYNVEGLLTVTREEACYFGWCMECDCEEYEYEFR